MELSIKKTICLNMIVKDESHVIVETLHNLWSYIKFDYYVVSDTGSTDSTKALIKAFFDSKGVSGELFDDAWLNFGHNRSQAFQHALNKSDYVFVWDADDRIKGSFKLPTELVADSYSFSFGQYSRRQLFNNHKLWKYVGVLHECPTCTEPEGPEVHVQGDYHFESNRTGARNKDPLKYLKDGQILEKAFYEALEAKDNIHMRYAYYCANSYNSTATHKDKAIEFYKKVLTLDNWSQEKYNSCIELFTIHEERGLVQEALHWLVQSHKYDSTRIEGIYRLIKYYCANGQCEVAMAYYTLIQDYYENRFRQDNIAKKLFVRRGEYEFYLPYYMIIVADRMKRRDIGAKMYEILFEQKHLAPEWWTTNLFTNLQFFVDALPSDNAAFCHNMVAYAERCKHLTSQHHGIIGKAIDRFRDALSAPVEDHPLLHPPMDIALAHKSQYNATIMFTVTTCKRWDLFEQTMNSILRCWTDVQDIGFFFCVDDNSSEEDREAMTNTFPFFEYHMKGPEERGHRQSMNIIWNKLQEVKPKYWIHMEDDWLFFKKGNYVGRAMEALEKYRSQNIHQVVFNKNYSILYSDLDRTGGKALEPGLHQHIKIDVQPGRHAGFWPHYSLQPSMCLTETVLVLGNYDSPNKFFERDYANKYFAANYQTMFFDSVHSLHIGKQHWETEGKNAYALNAESQFNWQVVGDLPCVLPSNTLPGNTLSPLRGESSLITNIESTEQKKTANEVIDPLNKPIPSDRRSEGIHPYVRRDLPQEWTPIPYPTLEGTMADHLKTFQGFLDEGRPFALIRPSDGEYSVIKNQTLTNCDKWTFKEGGQLSRDLLEAVKMDVQGLYIGIPCNTCQKPWNCTDQIYNDYMALIPPTKRTYANLFMNANWSAFIDHVKTVAKDLYVVTSGTHPSTELRIKERHLIDPFLVNSWDERGVIETQKVLEFVKHKRNALICFSAGPLSKVWIPKCWAINPTNTYLDVGAAFDPFTKGPDVKSLFYTDREHPFAKGACLFRELQIEPVSKKSLIYMCVFHNKAYLDLLKLLLASIKLFSNTALFDILVMTSPDFEKEVQQISQFLELPLNIHLCDFKTLHESSCARLYIYDYPNVAQYQTLLYIDTDILVQNDLTPLLSEPLEDKIYALSEGTIEHEYHGGWYFDFKTIDKDLPGMNGGILLFPNTPTICALMKECIQHIERDRAANKPMPACLDQPFLNYHFVKADRYDVSLMKTYALIYCINPPPPPSEPTTIALCHFVWPVGNAGHKLDRMRKHMTHLLDNFSKIYPSTPPESVPMLNNTYDWGKGEILFYPNMLFTTWDRGTHTLLDSHTAEVSWNKGYSHLMRFNKDYTKGLSIRKGDCDILAHSLKVEEPIVMKPYQPPVSNRKLIYTCVFGKKGYVQLLELLLVSIKLFGDIQNTDILIITESQFKEDIETISNIVGIPLNIQCLVLGKIMEPYYARLYIFNYENIAKYSTILYLDTDILVQHTLAPLLTHSLEDKIYAFKEGTIDSPDYGQQFFDFTINAENTPGFNSGVLLFPNTSTMHGLFQDCLQHITTHIQEGLPIPACPDQAFLNYHTIKRDLYEDTFINDYIMIYHHKVTFLPEKPTKTILYHFIWPQGNAEYKLQRMKSYMSHVLNNYTHLYPCNSLVKRDIVGKSLYWSNSSITFLQNKLLATIWREGSYEWLDTYTLNASFARHNHIVRFNETFDQAISVRTGDCDIQKHMENRSPFFYKDMEPCYIPPPVTSIVQTGRILFYFCVFCKEEYVTMFKLLLFSIRACTPLTKVDILVLTDRIVEASVQQVSKLLNIPIHTMIIEGIKTAHNASSARLDLFKYLPVYTYERVLYLDTDMLVQHDLTPLLTMPIKDCLYAVKGSEKGTDYCHGSWFFEDKAIMNRAEAFSAGTFLIKPTTAMRDIFIYTKHHITQTFVHNLPYPVCYEQPYLNFHCITAGKSDTQLLKPYLYLDHPTIEKPPAPLSEIAMIHYVDDNKMERMLPNLTRMVFEGIPSVPVEAALLNESYIWNGGRIQFLQNNIVATTWGTGTYQQVDTTSVLVSWKGFTHRLFFNEDRSEALSIRKGDCDMCKHTRIEDNRCSLIYACVFYNKDYIQLLRLLLLSIKMYSPLKQADFLVITSKEFEPLIQEVATEIQLPIRTMTLDITTIFQAACARLSIFDYPRIQDYAKLLYLDTDILVKGDLSTLLKIPLQDKLYALESGFTDSINFGVQFFQTPTKVTGLNSGTLLFPNSSILKALFHRIQNHINTYDGQPPYALDQPFINYHAIKDGLYENQALKPHVALFEEEQPANEESAIVCHFSFPIGNFGHKFYRMKNYFDKILSIATAFNETTDIQGKTYSWNKGFIKFHSTKLQTIWATGNYSRLDADRVLTSWRGSSHVLRLSPDRNSWFSIRLHDFEVVHGTLLDTMTPNFDPAMRTPLCEIMTKHGSDKGSKQHNYTTLYYNLLHTRQQEPLRIFEVGIGTTNLSITNNMGSNGTPGASLRGWAEFCPNAHIFAADIDKNILFEEDRIKTFYTDQLDRITIKGMWLHKELQEGFDLIVDDGLHTYDANVCFLENSIHKLRIGGYYIVEDIRNYDVPLFYAKLEGWRQAYPSYTFQLLLLENINLFDNTMLVIQRVE